MNWNYKQISLIILTIITLILGGIFWFFRPKISSNLDLFRNNYKNEAKPMVSNQASESFSPENKTVPPKKLVFLMYHYVEINQNKKDFKRDQLNTNPYIFEQQMLTLQKAGYKFIFPSEIKDFLNDKSDQKYVVVSFDDGYRTFYTYTYPIIKKLGIKSVNYIIYNFIGRQNNMDAWMIEQLIKDGLVEIGSHTLNHLDLTSLSDSELKAEIEDSKALLEKRFNIKVTAFCYPYGFYNSRAFPFIKEAGYLTATTTKEGSMISEDNLYEIKRIRPGILTGQKLLDFLDSINN